MVLDYILFKTAAARIAGIIENAYLKDKISHLTLIYEGIGNPSTLNLDIPEFLKTIVKQVPMIVGGGHCSIFLLDKNEISVHEVSSNGDTSKYTLIENNFIFKCKHGFASYIFKQCKPLLIDDVNNMEEIRKIDTELIFSRPEGLNFDFGPYLGVPLIKDNKVLGVIRVLRAQGARPFENFDKSLLSALSNPLSLAIFSIWQTELLKEAQKGNEAQFKQIFSEELIRQACVLKKVDYAKEINKFFEYRISEKEISQKILDLLENLWLNRYKLEHNFPLLKEFRGYEALLFELPRYRDHFIHQFQVFILGAIIIDGLYNIKEQCDTVKSFSDIYNESLGIKGHQEKKADLAWLITSTFHDVAYPIEKSNEFFNMFFDKFMGLKETIVDRARVEKILYDCNYGKLMDELCDLYVALDSNIIERASIWAYDAKDIRYIKINDRFNRSIRYSLIENRDHGVLGALILLHQSKAGIPEFSTIIYPSALAIALHNKLLPALHDDIVFEKNPLAFLLRYCDLVHEWGRGNIGKPKAPDLNKIDVYYDEDDMNIHVKTEIELGDLRMADSKAKEAEKTFNRLVSNKVVFEFYIQDNSRYFKSKRCPCFT